MLPILAAASTALYVILALRFVSRFGSSAVNESVRAFFMTLLAITLVLYGGAVIHAFVRRGRGGASLPIVLAALFGSFVCAFGSSIYL